jgi:hypothetical protein
LCAQSVTLWRVISPPCIFHLRFSTQNKHGGGGATNNEKLAMTPAPWSSTRADLGVALAPAVGVARAVDLHLPTGRAASII